MKKTIARGAFAAGIVAWVTAAWRVPSALDDSNGFLKNFVNHELLAFLGVVVTITLASATNLHLELNRLEEQGQREGFTITRACIKRSAFSLIATLLIAMALVAAKPVMVGSPGYGRNSALLNGAALLLALFDMLVLVDLTQAAFLIRPDFEGTALPRPRSRQSKKR